MINMPEIKLAVFGVSRDCFLPRITRSRLDAVMKELKKRRVTNVVDCPVVIENEADSLKALAWAKENGVNAACVFLGNFGPEGPTTILVERLAVPTMAIAAKEESVKVLANDRGDALCGMLNFSYNVGLRRLSVHIPEYPNCTASEAAAAIIDFLQVARVVNGLRNLKIFGFGPRPQDFFACNAPIQPLFDLGVNVEENSELDLRLHYDKMASRTAEIAAIVKDMKKELGKCAYQDLLPKLAQFELALTDWYENHRGASEYAVFANKCWPAFQPAFTFEPCYVNSRLAARGIPVACEVDLYGALSEYVLQCASGKVVTLLDINNSVPDDVLPKKADLKGADRRDLFMGFHCGNTCSACLNGCALKYQLIQHRLMEGEGNPPDITRGTMEGWIKASPTTLFRLQANSDGCLTSYLAEGHFLDVNPHSFGSIGVVAIPGFARFYRHVLIQRHYPHHGAFGFAHCGRVVFDALRLIGLSDVSVPLSKGALYPGENPFA